MRRGIIGALLLGATLGVGGTAHAAESHVFVLTSDRVSEGSSSTLELSQPWTPSIDVEPVGITARVRSWLGRHWVVNTSRGSVQVIDPESFETSFEFSVGADSEPHDIVVLGERSAWVTRHASPLLYHVDPSTGELLDSLDLSQFADPDGVPDMSMMALDGDRLLIQLQRRDRQSGNAVPPSCLAVVDVISRQLVDVDPAAPGTQCVELQGTLPLGKMHLDSTTRRLFVVAPGHRLEVAGGIEEIDLDALRSLGFILSEETVGADLGPFVMTSPDQGWGVFHTDIVPSSHLIRFRRGLPPDMPAGPFETFEVIRTLAYDADSNQLLFPDPLGPPAGIHVLDATSGERLTPEPVPTGLPPWDLVVFESVTPGEARQLKLAKAAGGELQLAYTPACAAGDHAIVQGPLLAISEYAHSQRHCELGATGGATFSPGAGSWYFLLAGADVAGREGSYGTDSSGTERPAMPPDTSCGYQQDLTRRCD